MRRWSWVLGILMVAACGEYDCEDLCKDLNECGEDQRCSVHECEANDRFNAQSGCAGLYDAMLECLDDNPDAVCDYTQGCDAETQTYLACVNDYCAAYPSECPAP
jgi:hypothetical protein